MAADAFLVVLADARRPQLAEDLVRERFGNLEQGHLAAGGLEALLLRERERADVAVHRVVDDRYLRFRHRGGVDYFFELHDPMVASVCHDAWLRTPRVAGGQRAWTVKLDNILPERTARQRENPLAHCDDDYAASWL